MGSLAAAEAWSVRGTQEEKYTSLTSRMGGVEEAVTEAIKGSAGAGHWWVPSRPVTKGVE
ncbi:hypothetical protein E2C01_096430 [Portunus trituberculatus]|uniref:Uncharacterized protein n=1 Tax=Portunus trituberculatus TaxID=210409 RepID=A0A5B7K2R4_PORTR|nr:hypothetical protein [Portunus trituberculatus]